MFGSMVTTMAIAILSAATAPVQVAWQATYAHVDPAGECSVAHLPRGGCYVSATRWSAAEGYSMVLLHYDPFGSLLWAQPYVSPQPGLDRTADLVVDGAGNAILAGRIGSAGGDYSIALLKYAPDGTRLWERIYARPGGCTMGQFDGLALAVDSNQNILLASHQDCKFLLMKIDPGGSTVWTQGLGGGLGDVATDVALDPTENVFVVGTTNGGAGPYAVAKLDPQGQLLWNRVQSGPTSNVLGPAHVAVGGDGTVVIAGSPETFCGLPQLMTWSYDAAGTPLWNRMHDDACNWSTAVGVVVDHLGNVIVGADQLLQYLALEYSAAGTPLWAESHIAASLGTSRARTVGLTPRGTVIVAGGSSSTPGTQQVFTTAAWDPLGNLAWVQELGLPSSRSEATDLSVDEAGNIYVTGFHWDSAMGLVVLTARYTEPAEIPAIGFGGLCVLAIMLAVSAAYLLSRPKDLARSDVRDAPCQFCTVHLDAPSTARSGCKRVH